MNERIKFLRVALKLTQDSFARELGLKGSIISLWEHGERVPSTQAILAICQTFHVSREWLLTGVGEMFEEREEKKLSEFTDDEIYTESMRRLFNNLPDSAKLAVERFADSLR